MSERHQVGDFSYHSGRGVLSREGEERRLEPQVNVLLKLLVEHAGETVSREVINARIWPDRVVGDDALRAMIRKLRDALGDSARNPRYIRTEPLKGYALIAPVTVPAAATTGRPTAATRRRMAVLAGLVIVAIAAVASWRFAVPAEDPGIRIELLTRMTGSEVSPDYSPAGNRLIFSHRANKDDFLQLYVKDLDSQRVQRLTWEPADYANAHWSPDGKEIIYSRSKDGQLQHFVAGFDSDRGIVSERPLLADDRARHFLLAWSNSERAVYLKDDAPMGIPAGISKLDLDSSKLTTITAPSVRGFGDFFAGESPSGKMLAVLREVERGKQELLILDKPTGSLLHTRILPRPANRFAWSEDESSLTLSSFSGDIQAFDLAADQFSARTIPAKGINDIFYQCGRHCLFMRQHNGNFLDLQEQPNPFLNRPLMASQNLDLSGAEDFPVFGQDDQGLFYVEKNNAGSSIKYRDVHGKATTIIELPAEASVEALQVNLQGTHLAGMLAGRVFLLEVRQPELVFLSGGADLAGFPYWSAGGHSVIYAKTEKGKPTLYRYGVQSGITDTLLRDFVAAVDIDGERSIRIDAQHIAWLFRGDHAAEQLAELPSVSPNRWQALNGWLYFTAHEGNLAVIHRVNLETGDRERKVLAKNRFRLNFDLSDDGQRAFFVKSLLAESNLVKVALK